MDVISGLVNVRYLATVDTNKRETNAGNEDIMDIRLDEDVVDVKVEVGEGRRGYNRSRKVRRRERTGVDDGTKKLLRGGKIDVYETLAVRNADRRNRETGIRVEPEKERDKHLKVAVGLLVRLVTVVVLERSTRVARGKGLSRVVVVLVHGGVGKLLAHVLVPAELLAFTDAELAVDVVSVRVVFVERVAVDIERDLLEKTLTREVAPTEESAVYVAVYRGARERDRGAVNLDVNDHIVEEITELRNRELNLRAKRRVVSNNLVVLETHGGERLEVGVHEEDVGLLNVSDRRIRVRKVLTSELDSGETARKRLGSHKHLILFTIVG